MLLDSSWKCHLISLHFSESWHFPLQTAEGFFSMNMEIIPELRGYGNALEANIARFEKHL